MSILWTYKVKVLFQHLAHQDLEDIQHLLEHRTIEIDDTCKKISLSKRLMFLLEMSVMEMKHPYLKPAIFWQAMMFLLVWKCQRMQKRVGTTRLEDFQNLLKKFIAQSQVIKRKLSQNSQGIKKKWYYKRFYLGLKLFKIISHLKINLFTAHLVRIVHKEDLFWFKVQNMWPSWKIIIISELKILSRINFDNYKKVKCLTQFLKLI